ncbi:MAG: late competence development ComFB family protein [Burkholderiales bacterium]|nr:late competence development ComFB family protein [Burkholderiales bacterium]MDE2277030.1 late competence development ComFB family protein [Burkholderiales bacterium]
MPPIRPAAASVDFSSVRNHNERAVYDAVQRQAERYPGLAHSAELLADVACVALNRLAPRYIRHEVDFVFYLSERERSDSDRQLLDAVEYAFGFVQARTAMRARG